MTGTLVSTDKNTLGEAPAIKPDDNPAGGEQRIVKLKVLHILKAAVGHARTPMLSMFSQLAEPLDLAGKLRLSAALENSVQVFNESTAQNCQADNHHRKTAKQLAGVQRVS